jgi:outer membrane protein insertion porin family
MEKENIRALILILLLASCLFPAMSSHASDYGTVIKSIEVKGLTRIDEAEFRNLLAIDTGTVLDRQRLSRAIRRAFKKGIFYDIQAVSYPYEGGLRLVFLVEEIPLIKKITIDGNKGIPGWIIKKHIPLNKGEEFREVFLDRIHHQLLTFYKRKGYHDARIEISAEDSDEPGKVSIRVRIVEGQPVLIDRIIISSDIRYLLNLTEGDIYDRDEVEKNINKLREYYRKRDYVSPVIGPYWFANGELTIPVKKGPKLKVTFKDNDGLSSRKLNKEVFFMDSGEVTDELVSETIDRVKALYVSKGYLNVEIKSTVERSDELIEVIFDISEGEKVLLGQVNFTGISVQPEALKKIITLEEGKPFNNDLLSSSKESLARFYEALGHLQMEVVEVKKEVQNAGREVDIAFVIEEGLQTTIGSIEVSGNESISTTEILDALKTDTGMPYNEIDIGDARQRVLSLYLRHGFLSARVEVESVFDEDRAFLTVRIRENKPFIVGKIIVNGNLKTKEKIIRREFAFKEGDIYNPEDIARTKQRLYRLGIFNEVTVDVLEEVYERDDNYVRDMLVSVKESKAGSVEFGIGYGDFEKMRGGFDIRYLNLGGYNRQVGFRASASSISNRFVLSFREPWFLNKPDMPLNLFLLKDYRKNINADTREILYKIDRYSFIAGTKKAIATGLKAGLGYEYSLVDTYDVKPDVILSRNDVGTVGISSIIPGLFFDNRENPFDPDSGSFHRVVVKIASKLWLSETEFIKTTLKSSWFFPLMKRLVLAVSFGGGLAEGFDEGTGELPLVERYFLGGGTTVRGYIVDSLGPKGEGGDPTGGNIFALTNWEFRLSVWKELGLVTFIDGGNVWQTFDDFDGEIKFTAGAGLRYKTPVGPVRVDYGHKLDREEGESSGEFHFSIGQAF